VGEAELDDIVKIGQAGENAKALVGGGVDASGKLLSDYEGLESVGMARTPRTAPQRKVLSLPNPIYSLLFTEDNVLSEARNLRNMAIARTPLLGDENTPLHIAPGGGSGFESATPRHQVAFTPNPLATPLHGGTSGVSSTPRKDITDATPLRTPMRDNLSINPVDGFSAIDNTPRKQRRNDPAQRALKAGFMNLPKPENNFELLVPEEEDAGDLTGTITSEEDAAERDVKLQRQQEEAERKLLARRSQVIQLGLPRPANVDVERLLCDLTMDEEEPELEQATRLIASELVDLLQHDSITHPIPGTSRPGGTRSTYNIPSDEDVATAKSEIHLELAGSLGFPNANIEQVREGLAALFRSEDLDQSVSWANIRQQLTFDTTSKIWLDPSKLSAEERVAGYLALMEENREAMAKEAKRVSKSEKKLGVTLAGYQVRSKAFAQRISDSFNELQKTKVEYESFSRLRLNESVVGPRRVEALKDEVQKLGRREKILQERHAELDTERRESEARVAAWDEKIMAEAEALNEAALAEMDKL
jgi:pre-mRNA-splicing factor CDC5/CEF1